MRIEWKTHKSRQKLSLWIYNKSLKINDPHLIETIIFDMEI